MADVGDRGTSDTGTSSRGTGDASKQFFDDLVAVQGNEPLSPRRAAEIKQRWGMVAPYVRDEQAERAAALLGLELVLTAALFVPPLTGFAMASLAVLALAQGEDGHVVLASSLPVGRLVKGGQLVSRLSRLQTAAQPMSMAGYQQVAASLLRAGKVDRKALEQAVKPLKNKEWKTAAEAAWAEYDSLRRLGDPWAANKAGNLFHEAVGAGAKGIDIRKSRAAFEIKTHYGQFADEVIANRGNSQLLGYALKEAVENGGTFRRARVIHVFIGPRGRASTMAIEPFDEARLMRAVEKALK